MFLRAVRVALMIALASSGGCAAQRPPFVWWTTHPLEKVKLLDPMPAEPAKTAELRAGRNEFEPFQIILRSVYRDLSGVDIEFSDLRGADGAEISSRNVAVYLESY